MKKSSKVKIALLTSVAMGLMYGCVDDDGYDKAQIRRCVDKKTGKVLRDSECDKRGHYAGGYHPMWYYGGGGGVRVGDHAAGGSYRPAPGARIVTRSGFGGYFGSAS